MPRGKIHHKRVLFLWLIGLIVPFQMSVSIAVSADKGSKSPSEIAPVFEYQDYIDFFESVYQTVSENYYHPIDRFDFDRFIEAFDTKIYPHLQNSGKSQNYIKWRSSAKLVEFLKNSEDQFSAFFPPTAAEEFEQTVLGKKIDMGIEGVLTKKGYLISRLEPRSDSYQQGIRSGDIITFVNKVNVRNISEEKLKKLLSPLEGETVLISYFDESEGEDRTIEVTSEEYFHQTVFLFPVNVPGIFGLEVQRFNRKTSEDMLNYLNFINEQADDSSLILDLRGNPGGPPLAAREIAAFFLPPGEEFAYFQRRDSEKNSLNVPEIPEKYHYKGNVVILVDEKSGSSSELFSGVMQKMGRAVVLGQNTAGQVFLKSMFHFDDDSMVLLVTARGYLPDGSVFPFEGITPDRVVLDEEKDSIIQLAAKVLIYMKQNEQN